LDSGVRRNDGLKKKRPDKSGLCSEFVELFSRLVWLFLLVLSAYGWLELGAADTSCSDIAIPIVFSALAPSAEPGLSYVCVSVGV